MTESVDSMEPLHLFIDAETYGRVQLILVPSPMPARDSNAYAAPPLSLAVPPPAFANLPSIADEDHPPIPARPAAVPAPSIATRDYGAAAPRAPVSTSTGDITRSASQEFGSKGILAAGILFAAVFTGIVWGIMHFVGEEGSTWIVLLILAGTIFLLTLVDKHDPETAQGGLILRWMGVVLFLAASAQIAAEHVLR